MSRGLFLLFLAVSTALTLTSCSKFKLFSETEMPYHYGILNEINKTMSSDPEQALVMLEKLGNSTELMNLKRAELYEYHTLLAEARYKCDLKHIDVTELIEASAYYDSLTNLYPNNKDVLYQHSRVRYYRGVAEEEHENYKKAFTNYLESLKQIENIPAIQSRSDEITHFKALIYVRLSDILYWLDVYEAAIECLNYANKLFESEDNQSAIVRNNIMIAMMYGHNYDYDKSFQYLNLADSLLMDFNEESPLKHDIERINSSILYEMGHYEEPLAKMLNQYNTLESENLRMEAAGIIGDIYYTIGELDSALFYYEQYFPNNKFSKIHSANHIIEIGLIMGNDELIKKYAPMLAEDTNKEIMLSSIKTELSSMYEEYRINKRNENIYRNILLYLGIILILTLIFFVFGLYLLRVKKNKYDKELNEKTFYINSLQEKINKKSTENKYIRQKIKSLKSELQDIKTKKYLMHAPFDMKLKKLLDEAPICKRLREINLDNSIKTNVEYPNLRLSESQEKEMVDLFNKTFNNAFNKIISNHEGLKQQDSVYLCLYLIGMDEKHISAVTGKTYNTIYNRAKRILEILKSEKTVKETLRDVIIQNYL
ncbi:MAG: hypothetical protein IJZ87_09260 [Bacteroidales bacterium]|nr:hypothetical protein [Bacteroidales bacterium]